MIAPCLYVGESECTCTEQPIYMSRIDAIASEEMQNLKENERGRVGANNMLQLVILVPDQGFLVFVNMRK